MGLNSKSDRSTNQGTHLENRPKQRERSALVLLHRVGHHDGTLGSPEEGRGDAKKTTGKNEEPSSTMHLECPESLNEDR